VKDPIFRLCDIVRQTAFDLHAYLRHGHLEKVYENGLAHRLRKQNLHAFQQHPLNVFDEDGTPLGEYFANHPMERLASGALGQAVMAALQSERRGKMQYQQVKKIVETLFSEDSEPEATRLARFQKLEKEYHKRFR
jgi:hypothetical protein